MVQCCSANLDQDPSVGDLRFGTFGDLEPAQRIVGIDADSACSEHQGLLV